LTTLDTVLDARCRLLTGGSPTILLNEQGDAEGNDIAIRRAGWRGDQ
jgi:hypothetical protein